MAVHHSHASLLPQQCPKKDRRSQCHHCCHPHISEGGATIIVIAIPTSLKEGRGQCHHHCHPERGEGPESWLSLSPHLWKRGGASIVVATIPTSLKEGRGQHCCCCYLHISERGEGPALSLSPSPLCPHPSTMPSQLVFASPVYRTRNIHRTELDWTTVQSFSCPHLGSVQLPVAMFL